MNPKNIIRMCLAAVVLLLGVNAVAKDNALLQRTYSVNLSSPQATVKSFTSSFKVRTGLVCPMRCERSAACSSAAGFHHGS